MTDFIFDENKIKKALITYCNKVNELYKAGNVESSYNKPIMDLISLFSCKPEDFSGGRGAESGENVDIKLWHCGCYVRIGTQTAQMPQNK